MKRSQLDPSPSHSRETANTSNLEHVVGGISDPFRVVGHPLDNRFVSTTSQHDPPDPPLLLRQQTSSADHGIYQVGRSHSGVKAKLNPDGSKRNVPASSPVCTLVQSESKNQKGSSELEVAIKSSSGTSVDSDQVKGDTCKPSFDTKRIKVEFITCGVENDLDNLWPVETPDFAGDDVESLVDGFNIEYSCEKCLEIFLKPNLLLNHRCKVTTTGQEPSKVHITINGRSAAATESSNKTEEAHDTNPPLTNPEVPHKTELKKPKHTNNVPSSQQKMTKRKYIRKDLQSRNQRGDSRAIDSSKVGDEQQASVEEGPSPVPGRLKERRGTSETCSSSNTQESEDSEDNLVIDETNPAADDIAPADESSEFFCNHCGHKYLSAKHLNLHLSRIKYCNECKVCLPSEEYGEHCKSHRLVCKYCNERFPTSAKKTTHEKFMKCKENFCRFCFIQLESKEAFERHIVEKHASMVKCAFCDVQLKRRVLKHYHRHTKYKPFFNVCPKCDLRFKTFNDLSKHECGVPDEDGKFSQRKKSQLIRSRSCPQTQETAGPRNIRRSTTESEISEEGTEKEVGFPCGDAPSMNYVGRPEFLRQKPGKQIVKRDLYHHKGVSGGTISFRRTQTLPTLLPSTPDLYSDLTDKKFWANQSGPKSCPPLHIPLATKERLETAHMFATGVQGSPIIHAADKFDFHPQPAKPSRGHSMENDAPEYLAEVLLDQPLDLSNYKQVMREINLKSSHGQADLEPSIIDLSMKRKKF